MVRMTLFSLYILQRFRYVLCVNMAEFEKARLVNICPCADEKQFSELSSPAWPGKFEPRDLE